MKLGSGRRLPIFCREELQSLDPVYFNIITVDEFDVTVMSRNTGHYWYLHNPEYPDNGTVIIFHSHQADRTGRVRYHLHGRTNTLRQAVRSIKGHDRWQMQGRPSKR